MLYNDHMNILDHWHPVLASKELKKKPVEIEIANKKIVIFRDKENRIGALNAQCPHRGMNLSFGKVQKQGLECLYHGWCFNSKGQGNSPCNPKLKVKTTAYDVREYQSFIWLTHQDSNAQFPEFDISGFELAGVHVRHIQAPIEPVMDNFLEVEHFPTAHRWLGYGFRQIKESTLKVESFPERVFMGFYPEEPLYWIVRKIFSLPEGAKYFMDINAYFSPAHTIHHQGWLNPLDGQKNTMLVNNIFYVPVDSEKTVLYMFLLAPRAKLSIFKNYFIRQKTGRLIDDDLIILNNLLGKFLTTQEMRLGYYDKALIEVRKRLPASYADYYLHSENQKIRI